MGDTSPIQTDQNEKNEKKQKKLKEKKDDKEEKHEKEKEKEKDKGTYEHEEPKHMETPTFYEQMIDEVGCASDEKNDKTLACFNETADTCFTEEEQWEFITWDRIRRTNGEALWSLPYPPRVLLKAMDYLCNVRCESVAAIRDWLEWIRRDIFSSHHFWLPLSPVRPIPI